MSNRSRYDFTKSELSHAIDSIVTVRSVPRAVGMTVGWRKRLARDRRIDLSGPSVSGNTPCRSGRSSLLRRFQRYGQKATFMPFQACDGNGQRGRARHGQQRQKRDRSLNLVQVCDVGQRVIRRRNHPSAFAFAAPRQQLGRRPESRSLEQVHRLDALDHHGLADRMAGGTADR